MCVPFPQEVVLEPAEVNQILTAVVAGMHQDEPVMETRLAATQALCNAVEFAEHNFDNEQERNYIMQVGGRRCGLLCTAALCAPAFLRNG